MKNKLSDNQKKIIKIILGIIIIVILLLLLKACVQDKNDDTSHLPKQEKVEIVNKKEYETKISDIEGLYSNYEGNFGDYLKTTDPYICDENTAQAFDSFAKYFKNLSNNYFNIKYVGTEPYADQVYFDAKYKYTYEFGEELELMAIAMRSNDTQSVLEGFDALYLIIEVIQNGEKS
ncbi:hypothetical protein G7061_09295 [Erysipelothrix sp. HDW6B]|uniref:hypothetical protein n=1 Tax=Erysipelothrix sp. HDW6B TaxID=2714929 RepID=UPI00140D05C8|nr:hypothetical protein [Erysipelothrix sp. HDW6B]QIK86795.1 hypothetical protein G7061_09295 [Erysipelothrix sp. HDW6B]